MRKYLAALVIAAFVVGAVSPVGAAETITGELISISCYFKDKAMVGKNGYTCALATVKWEGNPAGVVTADGKVYQIAGGLTANNNQKLWSILGHTVSITGEVTQAPGVMPTITASEAKSISPPK